jgi:hypothetical protein
VVDNLTDRSGHQNLLTNAVDCSAVKREVGKDKVLVWPNPNKSEDVKKWPKLGYLRRFEGIPACLEARRTRYVSESGNARELLPGQGKERPKQQLRLGKW